MRKQCRNNIIAVGRQDSSVGISITYPDQAVHLNLKMSCGLTEQTVNVVSSVPTSSVGPSQNFIKQRLVGMLYRAYRISPKRKIYMEGKVER